MIKPIVPPMAVSQPVMQTNPPRRAPTTPHPNRPPSARREPSNSLSGTSRFKATPSRTPQVSPISRPRRPGMSVKIIGSPRMPGGPRGPMSWRSWSSLRAWHTFSSCHLTAFRASRIRIIIRVPSQGACRSRPREGRKSCGRSQQTEGDRNDRVRMDDSTPVDGAAPAVDRPDFSAGIDPLPGLVDHWPSCRRTARRPAARDHGQATGRQDPRILAELRQGVARSRLRSRGQPAQSCRDPRRSGILAHCTRPVRRAISICPRRTTLATGARRSDDRRELPALSRSLGHRLRWRDALSDRS